MRGPEIPASVGTHLEAGFRLPNKHEHLDDLSLNPAATNAPEAQLLNSLLLPPEYNHSVRGVLQKERSSHRKRDPIFTGRRYRRSVLPHHSSASRFTVGAAEQRDEREHIQPQQEARYEADVWEDKIHDILLDKSRVTVGQVAIDGLEFETPAPPRSWIYHLKFTT
jgi:hypothetical protein